MRCPGFTLVPPTVDAYSWDMVNQEKPAVIAYLAMCPWDVERWQSSGAYRRMTLGGQGAYLNLCFAAWKAQPACALPDDDRDLWRLANAQSIEEWRAVKAEVFASDAWELTDAGWLNEVVVETYLESVQKHAAAVRSGRIAGKASARARRAQSQAVKAQQQRTTVQRPSTQERSTAVNPPSPSPSPDIRTFGASAPAQKTTWITPYCDAWVTRWGKDSVPPTGEIASAFSESHKTLGAADLTARWTRYLEKAKQASFARPARFVQELGQWVAPKIVTPPPAVLPRALRERDDIAATKEQIDAAKVSRL